MRVSGRVCGTVATIALAALVAASARAQRPADQGRAFPDTSSRIAIFADQLPSSMSAAQQRFAASHFVGSQKLTRDTTRALRAINPGFLVLHYHLAMWQSAPHVPYIVDGATWGNDFDRVNAHEDWFWHNERGQRVASRHDGKLLMNLGNPELRQYWIESLTAQVRAGDYDGVFADSASPAVLQWDLAPDADPRLAGKGAARTPVASLQGRTFVDAWQEFMGAVGAALEQRGVALIPNVGALVTTWDTTRYDLTAGAFSEGFAGAGVSYDDWTLATNSLLSLANRGKLVIVQGYLPSSDDVERRLYLLANYLLLKGSHTYLEYFARSPLEWYPEWNIDLGRPTTSGATVADLARYGIFRRDFERGVVLVNPAGRPRSIALGATFRLATPSGGGTIGPSGDPGGTIVTTVVDRLTIPAAAARILLR